MAFCQGFNSGTVTVSKTQSGKDAEKMVMTRQEEDSKSAKNEMNVFQGNESMRWRMKRGTEARWRRLKENKSY